VKEPLQHTVPAPVDQQYDGPQEMRKPLIPENQTDKNDLRNVYNPNKYQNHIGNYAKKDAKKGELVSKKAETNTTATANATAPAAPKTSVV
jgi:hypothetical protein